MASRDVVVGGIWYVSADGYQRFGTLGQSVDVHEGNVARFDEFNVSSAPADEPEGDDVADEKPARTRRSK